MKIKLRNWQQEFYNLLISWQKPEFLLSAGVGTGKTLGVLFPVKFLLESGQFDNVVIVAPQAKVKDQFVISGASIGVHLDKLGKNKNTKAILQDFHGIVLTYGGLNYLLELRNFVTEKTILVLDEIHHLQDCEKSSWYRQVKNILGNAGLKISLSGTPYNSNEKKRLPFCNYEDNGDGTFTLKPDYSYTFGEAVRDNVVCNPEFIFMSAKVRWSEKGKEKFKDLDRHTLTEKEESFALRTLLKPDNEFQTQFLISALEKLKKVRNRQNNYALLVVAKDKVHADYLQNLLAELTGEEIPTVTGDDSKAQKILKEFDEGTQPIIVAIRMISEGTSIDRIKLIAYLSNYTTRLFFEQVLGRAVRKTRKGREKCWMFLPKLPSFKLYAGLLEHEINDYYHPKPDQAGGPGGAPGEGSFEALEATTGETEVLLFNTEFDIDPDPVIKTNKSEEFRLECNSLVQEFAKLYKARNPGKVRNIGELIREIHRKANKQVGRQSQHNMTLQELAKKKRVLIAWMRKK